GPGRTGVAATFDRLEFQFLLYLIEVPCQRSVRRCVDAARAGCVRSEVRPIVPVSSRGQDTWFSATGPGFESPYRYHPSLACIRERASDDRPPPFDRCERRWTARPFARPKTFAILTIAVSKTMSSASLADDLAHIPHGPTPVSAA